MVTEPSDDGLMGATCVFKVMYISLYMYNIRMYLIDIHRNICGLDSSKLTEFNLQIKIISRQTGQPVNGPDEQGEICIKSPQCFIGYLDRQDLTNQVSNRAPEALANYGESL